MNCYPELNAKIVALLRMTDDPTMLYAAQRIEDLEHQLDEIGKTVQREYDATHQLLDQAGITRLNADVTLTLCGRAAELMTQRDTARTELAMIFQKIRSLCDALNELAKLGRPDPGDTESTA